MPGAITRRLQRSTEDRRPWYERLASTIAHTTVGVILRLGAIIFIAAVPVLRSWDMLKNPGYVKAWFVVFVLHEGANYYLAGKAFRADRMRLAEIHRAVAGCLDVLQQRVFASRNRNLTEDQAKSICVSLLARVKEFVGYETKTGDDAHMRATLCVPLTAPGASRPTSLRVWCYDRPYDDRRWTELQLPGPGETPIPGAPAAYVTGVRQIVGDIRTEGATPGVEQRRFRSILSVPIRAGGASGPVLAVVNIDIAQVDFFREDQVDDHILPVLMPTLNTVGFTLRLRKNGAHGFHT